MTRYEKILKGLSCCKWTDAGLYEGYQPMCELCEKCPYHQEDDMSECHEKLMRDAIDQLKKMHQEVQNGK